MIYISYWALLAIVWYITSPGTCINGLSKANVNWTTRSIIPQSIGYNSLAYLRKDYKYPHLYAFVKKGCEFCHDMEALLSRLKAEYKIHIECLDVAIQSNYSLMLKFDKHARCGGLPFYYNLATHQYICGATTYQNLVSWALGRRCHSVLPSPLKNEEINASYRKTGLYARLVGKLREILDQGERKMIDRLKNGILLKWAFIALTAITVISGYEIKKLSHTFSHYGHINDFGDYNGNGVLDILTYDVKDDISTIYVCSVASNINESEPLAKIEINGEVAGVIGVDLNNDKALDIFVIIKENGNKYRTLALYQTPATGSLFVGWRSTDEVNVDIDSDDKKEELDQKHENIMSRSSYEYTSVYPMLLDINGDGYVDILCQTEDNKLFVWTNIAAKLIPFLIEDVPFCRFEGTHTGFIPSPHSSAFVDIDGDCRPDLVLLKQHEGKRYLQIWQADAVDNRMVYSRNDELDIQLPNRHGQVSFVDINGDGTIDIAVPYCMDMKDDGECKRGSKIAVTFNKQKPFCSYVWNTTTSDTCRKATELCTRSEFKFGPLHSTPQVSISLPNNLSFVGNNDHPITLSFGDLNNSGYPDLIVLGKDISTSKPTVIVYNNIELKEDSTLSLRSFENVALIDVDASEDSMLRTATVDLFEDGITEIGIFSSPKSSTGHSIASFYSTVNLSTGLFMKTVVKGIIEAETPSSVNIISTGYNVYGPTFKITVIDVYGTKSPRCSTIRPQSAYAPLLPPYSMFGLGKTNNYVEEFYLGMPSRSSSYSNMWISIIPNCSVIAVPYRLFYPNEWTVKLSLSPSKEIYRILITAIICLVGLGIIIVGFDIKEKREDSEQEKGFRQKFIIN